MRTWCQWMDGLFRRLECVWDGRGADRCKGTGVPGEVPRGCGHRHLSHGVQMTSLFWACKQYALGIPPILEGCNFSLRAALMAGETTVVCLPNIS